MITIKTFDNYFTANIYLTRLESDGIPCFLADEYTATINPVWSNAIGGIKLMVREQDKHAAEKLLAAYHLQATLSATCPNCGSNTFTQIAKPSPENWMTALTTWLLSSYAVATKYVYVCGNCKAEYDNLPQDEVPA
jgi:DNA-directed RNA polymerase subunit RPC12/RpoP